MAFADHVARLDRHALNLLGERVPVIYQPGAILGGTFSGAFSGAFATVLQPAAAPVTGIFDDSYLLSTGAGEPGGVETRVPAVFLRLADLPSDPTVDDPILIIRGQSYRVFEHRDADFGSIVLALRRVV